MTTTTRLFDGKLFEGGLFNDGIFEPTDLYSNALLTDDELFYLVTDDGITNLLQD